MSTRYNSIQDNIRKNGVSNLSTEELIFFLYYASKDPKLKTINKTSIENYFYNINYSFYFENIFTNKGNYSQISLFIIGLLIPFYINYPKMYNLGLLGFLIGMGSFLFLYQFINGLYGSFFPSASKLFIIFSIIFYIVFFIFFNKLNHISLFFISSIVSFCIINYIYRLILTVPTKSNKYNKYNVKYEDKKNYIPYDSNIEQVCNEVIKRFGLNLPSGKMLYSYLTVFKMGENDNKISDFVVNLIAPFLTLGYNHYLGSFLNGLTNKEYISNKELQAIPIIGLNDQSKKYMTCQANYVLPIEFNFNSFIHEFYTEKELDDDQYRIFLKCVKRINYELLDKYKPKFVKLEDVDPELLKQSLRKNFKDRNHILVQLEKFYKEKGILKKDESLSDKINEDTYLKDLKNYIKDQNVQEKDTKAALELYHKINQTLEVITDYYGTEESKKINKKKHNLMEKNKEGIYDDDFAENIDLAIQVLLDNEDIKDESKVLLKKLCENYVNYFKKYIQQDKFYGYNYNLWTFKYFDAKYRESSNQYFIYLMRIISVYILFARPITSAWMFSIFTLIPKIEFKNYFKYFNEDSMIMKYLSMGMDDEYFKDEYTKEVNNNTTENVSYKLLYKFLVYIFVASPFLQFYNNTLYGMTFTPNYVNIIYILVFIINLIGNFNCESFGLEPVSFNIVFWIIFFIITIVLYFIKKK